MSYLTHSDQLCRLLDVELSFNQSPKMKFGVHDIVKAPPSLYLDQSVHRLVCSAEELKFMIVRLYVLLYLELQIEVKNQSAVVSESSNQVGIFE